MKYRHRVLGLLALLSVITYLDRVCIAVAGPHAGQLRDQPAGVGLGDERVLPVVRRIRRLLNDSGRELTAVDKSIEDFTSARRTRSHLLRRQVVVLRLDHW